MNNDRAAHVAFAHHVMLLVLRCKNANDRLRVSFTLMRADAQRLQPGIDWALENGFLTHGTTNASARAWNRFQGAQLYLSRAGKAWLRANDLGRGDLGSSRVATERMAAMKARVAA